MEGNQPSDAKVALIEKLIAEGKPQPPDGWKDDWKIASAYITEQLKDSAPKPASEKQLALVKRLTEVTGDEPVAEDLATSKSLSAWISARVDRLPKAPTPAA